LNQGNNNIPFDGSNLNSGMYNYRLVNNSGYNSGKIFLVK
jgi:hypothetical protein